MAENIFVDGMRFIKPDGKTPDFIRGRVSIQVDPLIEFLKKHRSETGWVNIDLKKSQKGSLYFALNTFKKKKQEEQNPF